MSGFFKKKLTLSELAEWMFNYTLNANGEYDIGIVEKARNSGYNPENFSFEYLCLRMVSTVLYVCNHLPTAFRDDFLDKWFACSRFYTESPGLRQIVQTTPDGRRQGMHDLMTERLGMYYKLAGDNPRDHVAKIAERFSQLCSGKPNDAWLIHIGESTFVVRGNAAWEGLKSVKVVPPQVSPS